MGIRLAEAALALNTGMNSNIGLDESPEARARCDGQPEAVIFEAPFPDGLPVCVNCSTVFTPSGPADADAACQLRCQDFYGDTLADHSLLPAVPPTDDVRTFCAHARAATNQPQNSCFAGACSLFGTPLPEFPPIDPRRTPEAVSWTDFIGTAAAGASSSDLTRTTAATATFDAGAASTQLITRGDAYVEFGGSQADQGHAIGLTEIPAACPPPCTDTDGTLAGIDFAMVLSTGGRVGIVENGTNIPGPDIDGTFGPYAAGERFRVRLRDNSDGTASVSFSRLVGICTPGNPCLETVLFTRPAAVQYPLRIDASLRQEGTTLLDVRVMRIQ
jgi:hypothetical protein